MLSSASTDIASNTFLTIVEVLLVRFANMPIAVVGLSRFEVEFIVVVGRGSEWLLLLLLVLL